MKRFVSALLAVAMLLSFCPMVLAEEAAAAIEAAQPDVTAEAAEQPAETAEPTETETPIEEETPAPTVQTALTMPMADLTEGETNEVVYQLDGAADWIPSTLAGAVTTIAKGKGTIKVLKDITLTAGIKIEGDITIIPGDTDVTITRDFANQQPAATIGSDNVAAVGDAMFMMYKTYNIDNPNANYTAKLTLGSENDTHTLTIDGNASEWGSQCNGPIIYLLGTHNVSDTIAKCTINKNVVLQNNTNCDPTYLANGGAIKICNSVELTITGATIKNCSAGKEGGAIYYDDTAYQKSFQAKINLDTVTFEGNSAQRGGAIYYDKSVTTLKNCKFNNNIATGMYGGAAIYTSSFGSTVTGYETQLQMAGCQFNGNKGTYEYVESGIFADLYKERTVNTNNLANNVVYFSDTQDEKTVVLGRSNSFNNKEAYSDICLYSDYGADSSSPVIYLSDDFYSSSDIRVHGGQYSQWNYYTNNSFMETTGVPIFVCAEGKSAAENAPKFLKYADDAVVFNATDADNTKLELQKKEGFDVCVKMEGAEPDNRWQSYRYFKTFDAAYNYITTFRFAPVYDRSGNVTSTSANNHAVITFLKDVTLNKTYEIEEVIHLNAADETITINVNFEKTEEDETTTILSYIFDISGGGIHVADVKETTITDVTSDTVKAAYTDEAGKVPECFVKTEGNGCVLKIGSGSSVTAHFKNFKCLKGVINNEHNPSSEYAVYEKCSFEGTTNITGYPVIDVVEGSAGVVKLKGSSLQSDINICYSNKNAYVIDDVYCFNNEAIDDNTIKNHKKINVITDERLYSDSTKDEDSKLAAMGKNNGWNANMCAAVAGKFNYQPYGVDGTITKKGVKAGSDNASILVSAVPTYAVTINKLVENWTTVGAIAVTGAENLAAVPEGTELEINKTDWKDSDFYFKRFIVTDAEGNEIPVTNNKFIMPASNVTVDAEYARLIIINLCRIKDSYGATEEFTVKNNEDGTLSYEIPGERGTATISADTLTVCTPSYGTSKYYKAAMGDTVTVSVTPASGYKYGGITKILNAYDNEVTTTIQESSFIVPTDAGAYRGWELNTVIEIEAATKTVTVDNSVVGGSISAMPSGAVNIGATVTLTQTADEKYEFVKWNVYKTGAASTVVEVNDNKFTMPSFDVTVSAVFAKKTHNVTVTTPSEGGTLSVDTTNPVTVDDTVTITATADEFYELDTITVKTASETKVTVNDNKFTMPDEDVTVSATFKKQQFAVTTQTNGNGTITVSVPTDGKSAWGEEVEYRVAANAHYDVASITVNEAAVAPNENGIYRFIMPKEDVTISATFKKHKYNITIEGGNITYTIPNAETFDWGESVTVTITPEQWYSITKVEASDSITVTDNSDGTYSFVMPSADVILTVTTMRPTYTVKFDTKGGSNIDPKVIANGESVVKPPAPEYLNRGFAGWYTDEAYTTKYDFTAPVTGDITLYARWFLWGDVNGDGRANAQDAVLIQRCRVGLEDASKMVNSLAGFVTGFNKAKPNGADAVAIQRHRVGLITRFSVEDSASGWEFNLEEGTYTVPQ